jgi:deazaflavin-dependent oxidoreductase (nitroreductase family)
MTMPSDMLAYNRELIEKFRADDGASLGDRPLLLLTTTGARTGQQRTSPMMYVRQGDRLLVIASNNGAVNDPAWLFNLRADPAVTAEMPGDAFAARAVVLAGDDRDRMFAEIEKAYPFFTEHQQRAGDRVIPVVELIRTN